jgi:micrococcal nuclease
MIKLFAHKFAFLWLLLFLASCTSTPAGTYKVIAVKDGDTIELLENGQPLKVRLYGIDAPEKNQDFGTRAKQFTSDLCFGKNVKIVKHNTDRYGRTVGTIILPDGRSLNEELVKNGMAWHYKAYSKDVNLANLETDARQYKRGLWSQPNPIAPWDFRKGRKTMAGSKTTFPVMEQSRVNKNVCYYCDSKGSNTYHYDRNCHILKRCKAKIKTTTPQVADSLGRTACKVCSR